MPVIMMSGHATIDTAVEATRIGAVDFLEKPITLQRLLKTISSALTRPVKPPVAATRPVAGQPVQAAVAPGILPAGEVTPAERPTETMMPVENEKPDNLLGDISLDQPLREARDEFERIYFEYHLAKENYSMTRVSERTGLERTHLYRKLKQLGIESRKRGS